MTVQLKESQPQKSISRNFSDYTNPYFAFDDIESMFVFHHPDENIDNSPIKIEPTQLLQNVPNDMDDTVDFFADVELDDTNDTNDTNTNTNTNIYEMMNTSNIFMKKKKEKKNLEKIIIESFEDKPSLLKIEKLEEKISNLPEKFKEMDWITELVIESNIGLETLDNLPPNLIKLTIQKNQISIIDGTLLPDILEFLMISRSKVKEVHNLKEGIIHIDLHSNYINFLASIPKTTKIFKISGNPELIEFCELHEGLEIFDISETSVENIDFLPDSIEQLITTKAIIPIINKLPKNLKSWTSYQSSITKINCELPENLEVLDLYANNLMEIPKVPRSIKRVDLSQNELTKICDFPYDLIEKLELNNNKNLPIDKIWKEINKLRNKKIILYDDVDANTDPDTDADKDVTASFDYLKYNSYSTDNPYYIVFTKTYTI